MGFTLRACLFLGAVGTCLTGCPEDAPQSESPAEVGEYLPDAGNEATADAVEHRAGPFHVRFDPDEGFVPYPTVGLLHEDNLWRNTLSAPVQHLAYFAKQGDGFPTTQVLTVPLAQPPDLSSLPGNLLVRDVASGQSIDGDFSWHESRSELVFTPTQPFAPGTQIQTLFRGGTTGIRSVAGETLTTPLLFYRCLIENQETDDCDYFFPDREALWAFAESAGFNAQNLAFTHRIPITAHTEIQGSVYFQQGVFPDNQHWREEWGRSTVPAWLVPPSVAELLGDAVSELQMQNEFSISGGFFVPFANAHNPIELTDDLKIKLFWEDPLVQEHETLERHYFEDEHLLHVRPAVTLEPHNTYVYRAAGITDRGLQVVPQERVALLTGPDLVDATGQVLVPGLSTEQALELAAQQERLRPYLDRWQADGLDLFSVAALGDFTTLSASERLLESRDELLQLPLDLNFENEALQSPWDRGLWPLLNDVETVYTGDLTLHSWLEPYSRRATATPQNVRTQFVLTLPENPSDPSNVPVVLFGHGINTGAELAYGVANFLADAGYAVFAIDLPYHGVRSPCTEDAHCSGWGSTCRGDGQCINDDNSLGTVRKSPNLFSGGPQVAITTGTHFFEIDDLIATRDHFVQALRDQMQARRVLQNADWVTRTGFGLNTDAMSYLGISLGSILGASLSPIEPDLQKFALNVGGADVTRLLENSTALSLVLSDFLRQYEVEPDDFAYTAYTYFARWLLDAIDPINLVQHTLQDPLVGIGAKNALIQMCENDLVVPNRNTELLSDRMGQPFETFSPLLSNHGFLVDPTSLSGGAARDQIVDFLDQTP